MAVTDSYRCPYCDTRFCVVGQSYTVDPGICRRCIRLRDLDAKWNNLDTMIAFHEGPEALGAIQEYRANAERFNREQQAKYDAFSEEYERLMS